MGEDQHPPSIDDRVAAGDYAGAAAQALAQGDLRRAISLLERIWNFADAVPLALKLGDAPLAIRLAIDARDAEAARRIALGLDAADVDQVARAVEVLAGRGLHELAGVLDARAGRHEQAAAAFQRAGLWFSAGGELERAGRFVEAGQLYEKVIREGGREVPSAALALGHVLERLGRHREAAAALQLAARDPETRVPAWRRLCVELLALDLPVAAQEIAQRLHRTDAHWPNSALEIAALEAATPSPAADGPVVPQRFRILQALGAGSLGRVYAALDTLLGRTVALKLLSAGAGAEGPERLAFARFLREAEASSRLHHPHIVAVYEIRPQEGILVMEHLGGGTLADRLEATGALDPASVRRLALEVLAGLEEAHSHGIVHRDVKPANILFDSAGNAKLGDFGAAHLLDFGQTQTGGFIGTLAYLSPEQITGDTIGAAADLYALGATLFEALTGRPPFLGPDLVAQHLGAPPPAAAELRPGLPAAYDQVLRQALEKSPEARFASAAAMAEAIRAWPVADVPAPPRVVTTVRSPKSEESPPPRLLGHTPRGRLLLVVDPRVRRPVLREELDQPLEPAGLQQIHALAAAGGPHVQRILALDPDLRGITYESIEGEATRFEDLSPAEQRALELNWGTTPEFGPVRGRQILRAQAGPVVLIAPALA
jgi:eukaryotic-like serine/threonine-protein kinase